MKDRRELFIWKFVLSIFRWGSKILKCLTCTHAHSHTNSATFLPRHNKFPFVLLLGSIVHIIQFLFSFSSLLNCSDTALPGFSYCADNGLNFSTNSANFSEDDADFAPGRRNKPSRVSIHNVLMRQDSGTARFINFYFRFHLHICSKILSPTVSLRNGDVIA